MDYYLADDRGEAVIPGGPFVVNANSYHSIEIQLMIHKIFEVFVRYTNTDNTSGTVEFKATDNAL